jgi:hypothetical protein
MDLIFMITEKDIINDIIEVKNRLKTSVLSRSEYYSHGKYNSYQIYDDGKSWEYYCQKAGIKTKKVDSVSDDEYFIRLKDAIKILGRYPKVNERKKYGLNFSKRRYPTLKQFIEKAIELEIIEPINDYKNKQEIIIKSNKVEELKYKIDNNSNKTRISPPIPKLTRRKNWSRIDLDGHPYSPHDELGVIAIFAILCHKHIINWQILDLNSNGIDAVCYDYDSNKEIIVELKLVLSKGSWNHDITKVDYVVCWKNSWHDFPKPVIELNKYFI